VVSSFCGLGGGGGLLWGQITRMEMEPTAAQNNSFAMPKLRGRAVRTLSPRNPHVQPDINKEAPPCRTMFTRLGGIPEPPEGYVPPLGASRNTWTNIYKNKGRIDYCVAQFGVSFCDCPPSKIFCHRR
jgi:hypothetical protein